MTTSTTERENTQLHLGHNQRPRDIVHRARGISSGPITRLVSPSDWGGFIKPFVFLDLFDFEGGMPPLLNLAGTRTQVLPQ
ncbi:Pirin-related protein [Pseudomonas chlororaphis subsp. aureofaciens]|nr:Pirin-related protein [Pseudomonas chlororaphis subsp. aureofaciens]AZE42586.1 Pirin-related protein [Pseudomonas chlororaphis subsp. aureofaciens]